MANELQGLSMNLDARRVAALMEECFRCVEGMPKRGSALEWGVQWLARQGVAISFKSIERKFYAWRNSGKNQLAVVDRRRVLGKNTGKGIHNPAFVAYWVALAAEYQRSVRSAYNELCRRWKAGDVIPGYENEWRRATLPVGWSYRNLCTVLPTAGALDIYRKGMMQAQPLLPSVRTTRAGSYPTEFVFFDDVWVDRLSRFGREINRCMQLGCLDFCTGMRLTAGTKFRHRRADGTHVYFNNDDMLMQVAAFLHDVGYNATRGTTLVVENGTAAITPEVEAMIQALTGGKVRVHRAAMQGMRQLLRGYGGRGKGNPRDKAHLESWHNLFHNRLCHGNGWAGKDRTPPETAHGIIQAEKQHIKNLLDLPIDRAVLSQGHLPTFAELAQEIARVTGEINQREDHALEGWRECGFERLEYTLSLNSGVWGDVDALAGNEAMMGFVQQLPRENFRVRRMSPAEAWAGSIRQRGNELTQLSDEQCAMLMSMAKEGGVFKHKVKAEKGVLVWRDKTGWLDYSELHFVTTYNDAMGYERPAPWKDELQGVLNPFCPDRLFLFDARGVMLGSCRQLRKVARGDIEALHSEMGKAAHRKALQLEYLEEVLSPLEQEALAKREWNKRVADLAAPVTIAEEMQQHEDKLALRAATRGVSEPVALPAPDGGGLGLSDDYAPSSFNQ